MSTTTLWRPVGAYELRLIAQANFRRFPDRLPEQPYFYPVCNEVYASEIATKWNLFDSNAGFAGFVTRFEVPNTVAERYPRQIVGARRHEELWVPAEDLAGFCDSFVGPVVVVAGWLGPRFGEVSDWSGPLGALSATDLAAVVAEVSRVRGGPATGGA